MADDPSLTGTLREHGYRVTPPRRRVWDVLVTGDGHLTAEQILSEITRRHADDVNLASVYRALALMEDLDLVRSSRLGDASSTWELAHPDEHFHLVCRNCGDVDHHEGTLVDQVDRHLRDGHGFQPETIELVVTGLCAACAAE